MTERKIQPLTSGQVTAVCSSATMLPTHQTTRCHTHMIMTSVFTVLKSSNHTDKRHSKENLVGCIWQKVIVMHSCTDTTPSDFIMKVTVSECQVSHNIIVMHCSEDTKPSDFIMEVGVSECQLSYN